MVTHVLDDYYLGITAIVTVVYQLIFFSIAFSLKFDKLTDFAGGTNFILLAVLTLGLSSTNGTTPDTRQILASLMLIVWSLRLALFLAYRVHKTGKDDRFDDKRDKFLPFLGFWIFQMIWVFVVSLPVTLLNSPAVRGALRPQPAFGTGRDIAGLLMWGIGFLAEAVGDWQRFIFRERSKQQDVENGGGKGKAAWCDTGLWSWSRHPNYFGEILLQFGIYTLAVTPALHYSSSSPNTTDSITTTVSSSSAAAALHASIVGPVLLTALLLFVSGLTLSERPGAKKRWEAGGETWEGYKRYLARTSILIPLPPVLYAPLPTWMKRTVLFEWGIYRFDPAKHAAEGKPQDEEARGREDRTGMRRSGEEGLVER